MLSRSMKETIKRRMKRRNKPPRWLFPFPLERKYKKTLSSMFKEFKDIGKDVVLSQVERIVKDHEIAMPKFDAKLDYLPDNIDEIMKLYFNRLSVITDGQEQVYREIARGAETFNSQQWYKLTNAVMGVNLFQNEPWLDKVIQNFVHENVTLIKKVGTDVANEIEMIIRNGVRQGLRHETISQNILRGSKLKKGVFNKLQTRASLIARDQVAKINGQLTQNRQKSAGINEYIWETSVDERVRGRPGGRYATSRPSHWELEGMICSWDDPTIYKATQDAKWSKRSSVQAVELHPGQDINCRCTATANFEGLEFLRDEPSVVNVLPSEPEQ